MCSKSYITHPVASSSITINATQCTYSATAKMCQRSSSELTTNRICTIPAPAAATTSCYKYSVFDNLRTNGLYCSDLLNEATCKSSYVHLINGSRHRKVHMCEWVSSKCMQSPFGEYCPDAMPPNIFFTMMDDLGWDNTGYRKRPLNVPPNEIKTPHMDALVREGIDIHRHYSHHICTPSRASFLSGRIPMHVLDGYSHACGDEVGAVPLNMTTVADKLSYEGGYMSHFVGKWDNGARYWEMMPTKRGYDSFLGIFSKATYSYSHLSTPAAGFEDSNLELVDFWENDSPAYSFANSSIHQELHFRDRLMEIVHKHDTSRPLYLHYASRHPHVPLQATPAYVNMYKNVSSTSRAMYMAMISMVDDIIGDVTQALKQKGMWKNTLMIFTSDNGGFVDRDHACAPEVTFSNDMLVRESSKFGTTCLVETGGNNWPLRGGKYSLFEGGIRVNTFVSGGFIPHGMRGTSIPKNIMHVSDWYTTMSRLANVHEFDYKGNESIIKRSRGNVNDPNYQWARPEDKIVPPVDGLNLWPTLSTGAASPRREIFVDKNVFLKGKWKFFKHATTVSRNANGGPLYPNETTFFDS
eukprot:3326469-Pleurochrysis_carterae.AAC.2